MSVGAVLGDFKWRKDKPLKDNLFRCSMGLSFTLMFVLFASVPFVWVKQWQRAERAEAWCVSHNYDYTSLSAANRVCLDRDRRIVIPDID